MARLSTINTPAVDPTSINLTRMIARLQKILITPDQDTEVKLRSSSLEREKVGTNLEYARSLLLKLEQDARTIKVQTRKQETQVELSKKREMLERLNERLDELNELGAHEDEDDYSSEGEDILGEDTPSEETDSHSHASHIQAQSATPSPTEATSPTFPPTDPSPIQSSIEPTPDFPPSQLQPESNVLRSRIHKAEKEELLATTTGSSISPTSEALLTHNRTEQESLTASLLAMASALKESSQAFSSSLESDKGILDSAASGLDKNELGMQATQRRFGNLRKMTEGMNLFRRAFMYAYIAGLMVLAILIVFAMPKLRF